MNALLKFEIPAPWNCKGLTANAFCGLPWKTWCSKVLLKRVPLTAKGKHLSFTVHYLLPQLALFLGDYRIYANMRCLSGCYPNSLNSHVSVYLTINYYTLCRKWWVSWPDEPNKGIYKPAAHPGDGACICYCSHLQILAEHTWSKRTDKSINPVLCSS